MVVADLWEGWGVWGMWEVWGEVYSSNTTEIKWRTHSLFTFSHLCDYL
ncbi:MAG: hypothetical protein F6K17_27110 [Okeania sp. SIO3C4]|nr:hypothetical protein [Okeania sp. SIO3B3]NER05997.1 hypothetical protein [Okeania sp. SIO3C4]